VPSAKAKMMPKEKLEWQLQLLVNRSIDCSVPKNHDGYRKRSVDGIYNLRVNPAKQK